MHTRAPAKDPHRYGGISDGEPPGSLDRGDSIRVDTKNGPQVRRIRRSNSHTYVHSVTSRMGNTDDEKSCLSYGRWLFITYDNGLSSIYGHLSSITVKTGDQVKSGQVVAYSGGQPGVYGSGYATGPHLHMGLFNTAGVSIQQYTSSIGCKNVSIPLANPSDYLDPMAYLPLLQ